MTLSVPQVIKGLLETDSALLQMAQGGVVVGAADDDQISATVVSVEEKGWQKCELYLPIVKAKFGICINGPDLKSVEPVKSEIIAYFHYGNGGLGRQIVRQNQTEELFLVHSAWVMGGPVQRHNAEIHSYETEYLIMEIIVGTDAIGIEGQ